MTENEMSLPATKGDIIRLYDKLDKVEEGMATLQAKQVTQPCPWHYDLKGAVEKHIEQHEKLKNSFWDAVMKESIRLVVALIVVGAVVMATDRPVEKNETAKVTENK